MTNISRNYQLPNGTYVQTNEEGGTYYECQFCLAWFKPKKRFVQKFCSESCRVLSCRENNSQNVNSKHDKSTVHNRKKVTNKDLSNQILEAKEVVDELKHLMKRQENKISSIKNNQNIHMLISGLMPLVAEPLKKGFTNMLNRIKGNPNLNTYEKFQAQTNHWVKDLPEDLQTLVNVTAMSFYQKPNLGTNPTSNKNNNQAV